MWNTAFFGRLASNGLQLVCLRQDSSLPLPQKGEKGISNWIAKNSKSKMLFWQHIPGSKSTSLFPPIRFNPLWFVKHEGTTEIWGWISFSDGHVQWRRNTIVQRHALPSTSFTWKQKCNQRTARVIELINHLLSLLHGDTPIQSTKAPWIFPAHASNQIQSLSIVADNHDLFWSSTWQIRSLSLGAAYHFNTGRDLPYRYHCPVYASPS